jgi:hexosaminidase
MTHVATDVVLALLLPRPQRVERRDGTWSLPPTLRVRCVEGAQVAYALERLEQVLRGRGHALARVDETNGASHVRMRIAPLAFADALPANVARQAYTVIVDDGSATLTAIDAIGLAYALSTFTQLIELAGDRPGVLALPHVTIEDSPDFPVRGVMLDISRDKVPTLATLQALIDRLAYWKVNQLQLYMEHTFAYAGHDVVWRDASALTADEVRSLDAYCASRHVELVPNQNSFGHMHRWLAHEPYRKLAECPDGFAHPWNWRGEPYGLCATDPASFAFLEGLYDQLLPNFRSRSFNVGLDEPLDLGCGRSKTACETRGPGRVYLDFLKAVHAKVESRGHTMAFWGDTIASNPELIDDVPKNAIVLEWGYEANHPFAERLAQLRGAGLECYVCPGTSSWNSFAGRTQNAVENIANAARAGNAAGAEGFLNTDWGDHGHLQPLSVSSLGFLLGAALSWNAADAEHPFKLDLPRLLDVHVFGDSASELGRAAHDLGNAYLQTKSLRSNASVLFWSVLQPERLFSPPGVTRETLARTLDYVERVGDALLRARPRTSEGTLAVEELGYARDLLRFACRLGIARAALADPRAIAQLPPAERGELAKMLGGVVARHGEIWALRNRPGGRSDSVSNLTRVLDALTPEGSA